MNLPAKKPDWLRVRLPGGEEQKTLQSLQKRFRDLGLATVCEEARCPNIFECWGQGTATIMILGDVCTRGCRFCSVDSGKKIPPPDPLEPIRTATALEQMDLAYVVLTMVDRDDLPDGGAQQVANTIQEIHRRSPDLIVEALVGDFQGQERDVETVLMQGQPEVFAHNVEVVPRLQRTIRDARCSWEQSTSVLKFAKALGARVTKSSLMVGLGETENEVIEAMQGLREADVDVLTIGQYLQPTKKHTEVVRYVAPEEFDRYAEQARAMGFAYVAAGPLVRSSYRAAEAFVQGIVREKGGARRAQTDHYGRKRKLSVIV